jgi:hypothetical protein
MLRTLLVEPLWFTRVVDKPRRGYAFEGSIAVDRLLSGVIDLLPFDTSPKGLAPFSVNGSVVQPAV